MAKQALANGDGGIHMNLPGATVEEEFTIPDSHSSAAAFPNNAGGSSASVLVSRKYLQQHEIDTHNHHEAEQERPTENSLDSNGSEVSTIDGSDQSDNSEPSENEFLFATISGVEDSYHFEGGGQEDVEDIYHIYHESDDNEGGEQMLLDLRAARKQRQKTTILKKERMDIQVAIIP